MNRDPHRRHCGRHRCIRAVRASSTQQQEERRVIIIGGGIAGLSTAVALASQSPRRFDAITVLERRTAEASSRGAALSLWSNGWRVLDALHVGEELRSATQLLDTVELLKSDGSKLTRFTMDEAASSNSAVDVEVRGCRRGAVSEALLRALDRYQGVCVEYEASVDAVRGKRSRYEDNDNASTAERTWPCQCEVVMSDGTLREAELVVIADGARSSVSEKLGVTRPGYCGYAAIRGVAKLEDDRAEKERGEEEEKAKAAMDRFRSIGGTIRQYFGSGTRFGMYPLSETEIYWFVCFNAKEGERIRDVQGVRERAMRAVRAELGWEEAVRECVRRTSDDDLSPYTEIVDNWRPQLGGQVPRVAFVGDANHAMSPNLGQGGCCALEDAWELAKAMAIDSNTTPRIEDAIVRYHRRRALRCTPLTVRAGLMGLALQIDNPIITMLRDSIIVPKVFSPNRFLNHTVWEL